MYQNKAPARHYSGGSFLYHFVPKPNTRATTKHKLGYILCSAAGPNVKLSKIFTFFRIGNLLNILKVYNFAMLKS